MKAAGAAARMTASLAGIKTPAGRRLANLVAAGRFPSGTSFSKISFIAHHPDPVRKVS